MKISKSIRRQIAEAIVKQSHPGYDSRYHGESFAVDTDNDSTLDTVMFRDANAAWNPWADNAVAISVEEIYAGSNAEFAAEDESEYENAIEFALGELPKKI